MIGLFWDEEHGGFYFTGHDAEALIVREKEVYDGAVPSGNSVAAVQLLRLGQVTGDYHSLKKQKRCFLCSSRISKRIRAAMLSLCKAC